MNKGAYKVPFFYEKALCQSSRGASTNRLEVRLTMVEHSGP